MQSCPSTRLFVGFSLDEPQTQQILHLQQSLKHKTDTNSAMVLAHNLHLTLGFFGSVDPTSYADILTAIEQMPKTKFSQTIDTLDWWQAAKTICLKGQACASLHTMADAVRRIADIHQLAKNQYDYIPHISLFRGVTSVSLPKTKPNIQLTIAPSHLHLYQSTRQHNNAHYTILKSWPLKLKE
ncbi:RNA 2',3'-cyclic phosphodiesterase [Shewanella sp. MEBiC00475]|uniref:RNA 2',3'-cyclic phosphodiesterase n=1 Tax=Shewanella sp. MEBiC00475 TaxID=2575361 RepID=UPI0010C0C2C2|nr:RNA 2',3'-cyclic phosphodiesterase [Shewanella sp. MEBiC00475]